VAKELRRHSKPAILIHWFNAVCWLFLFATGIGLIANEWLQPVGMWWPSLMRNLLGGATNLFWAHVVCGFLWSGVIREIFSFTSADDLKWLIRKPIQMMLGNRALARVGLDTAIPPQGFYNAGQKIYGVFVLLGGSVAALTGIVMIAAKIFRISPVVLQWSILLHFVVAGVVFAGFLIHMYMAALARGEFPALVSMFTGTVSEKYAREHHKYWYDEVAPHRKPPSMERQTRTGPDKLNP
jgi:formate dehydrogenase subunit gamma